MSYQDAVTNAAYEQGFEDPLQDSPIETPERWHDGRVDQTGGFIMVRTWRTWEAGEGKARDVEYECAYGSEPGVSITRKEWNEELGGYEFAGEVTAETVDENTDKSKAEAAKSLMEEFSRPDDT